MNTGQKLVRWLGLILMVIMVLFPPWRASFTNGPEQAPGQESIGYHPLWFRLELDENDTRSNVQQRIDLVRLGLQLGGLLVATNVGIYLLRSKAN